jgi:hypothetical protein
MDLLMYAVVGFALGAVLTRWWAPFVVALVVGLSYWLLGDAELPGMRVGLAEAYAVEAALATCFGTGFRRMYDKFDAGLSDDVEEEAPGS